MGVINHTQQGCLHAVRLSSTALAGSYPPQNNKKSPQNNRKWPKVVKIQPKVPKTSKNPKTGRNTLFHKGLTRGLDLLLEPPSEMIEKI